MFGARPRRADAADGSWDGGAQPGDRPGDRPGGRPGGGPPTGPLDRVIDLTGGDRLRDEPDLDPVVEEAAQRLRDTLSLLDARDEWGRPVAWRLVARIALGSVLPEVSRLLGRLPAGSGEVDLLEAARAAVAWERSSTQPAAGVPAVPASVPVAYPQEPEPAARESAAGTVALPAASASSGEPGTPVHDGEQGLATPVHDALRAHHEQHAGRGDGASGLGWPV